MIIKEIDNFIVKDNFQIIDAMKQIDLNLKGIVFVVDEKNRLIGSLSDGDIRRWIIKTGNINVKVTEAMNRELVYSYSDSKKNYNSILEDKKINCLPIVDSEMIPKSLFLVDYRQKPDSRYKETPVVIMAGGKGTRLYPYTKILPKPLIPIGDIPILERILKKFNSFGFYKFYITVNYKKEMIKSYFADQNLDFNISFIEEDKPLGTAGSIKLIKEKFDSPIIITNCDILIDADYNEIISNHLKTGNDMTIVSSLKNITIPYGVINPGENGIILGMKEKPEYSFFINTGMYVINPKHISLIPEDTFFHMTNLTEKLIEENYKVGMFPISEESYLDMGQFEEMKRMEEIINSGKLE